MEVVYSSSSFECKFEICICKKIAHFSIPLMVRIPLIGDNFYLRDATLGRYVSWEMHLSGTTLDFGLILALGQDKCVIGRAGSKAFS